MLADFEDVLDRLKVASRNRETAMCFCPAHDDRNNPSLSLKAENGRLLLHCFAGCQLDDIVTEMGLEMKNLFVEGGGGSSVPSSTTARLHAEDQKSRTNRQNGRASGDTRSEHGCTLEGYSEQKKLPEDFLRGLGLRDVAYMDKPAVRIPYPDEEGQEVAVRFRVTLNGTEKFRWRSGGKPTPYGLRLLEEARKAGYIVLVEGESDCHTLWYYEIPALGVPGASNWRDKRVRSADFSPLGRPCQPRISSHSLQLSCQSSSFTKATDRKHEPTWRVTVTCLYRLCSKLPNKPLRRGYPTFFSNLSSHALMPISCSISASWCSHHSRS